MNEMKPVKLDSSCPQYQTYLQDLQDSAVAAETENLEYGGAGDEPDLQFFSDMEQILVPQAFIAYDEQLLGGVAVRYEEKVGRGCTLCDFWGADFEHKSCYTVIMRFIVLFWPWKWTRERGRSC